MSFLDTRDRTIIVGDVFTSIGGLAVSNHFYLRFPLAAMATWDKGKDLESAAPAPSAGPGAAGGRSRRPVRDPGAAMDKAVSAAGG